MRKRFLIGVVFSLLIGLNQVANAALAEIHLDADINKPTAPIVLNLTAGSYKVTPFAGTYTAWNPWGYTTSGWANDYSLSSDEFDGYTVTDGGRYSSPGEALANALSTTFTLTVDGNVNFYIADSIYTDNTKGMSLRIDPVPIPGAVILLFSGLVGLAGIKKRHSIDRN